MEILERAIDDIAPNDGGVIACAAYLPFDKPAIMETAVTNICPKIMVLLESKMCPGLLAVLSPNS